MRPTIVRLDDLLSLRARTHADHPAIVADGRTTTYAELDARAGATARRLAALGVGAGTRVATTLPGGLHFAALLHAGARLGATLVPIDTRLTREERRAQLEEAGARLVLDEPPEGAEAELDLPPRRDPEDPWTLLFTSGTTGRPKPVLLSRRNHLASALASAWALGVAPDDRWLCVLPVFHIGGLAILIRAAVYGTTAVVHERFDAGRAAAALASGEVTLGSLVPTMLRRIREVGLESAPALRALLLGGASSPRDLLEWSAGRGLPVVRTYGMTETASQVAVARPGAEALAAAPAAGTPPAAPIPSTVAAGARPLPGVELAIGPDDEILVRGAMVAARSVAGDGWLHTGDRGRLDEHGLLHVEGRLSDLIVTGGEKVPAIEVEEALLSHPGVSDAGVVGMPHDEWGEAVTAFVVLASGAVEGDELRAHCRARMAGYKVPKEIAFVPALPRNAAGKLDRTRLAALPRARNDH